MSDLLDGSRSTSRITRLNAVGVSRLGVVISMPMASPLRLKSRTFILKNALFAQI